jgi:tagaturonate reductase
MQSLNRKSLGNIQPQADLEIPDPALLDLPEKVLQFGTGVLLRGLPDYFIDRANKAGIFNGRVLVVKSTSRGDTDAFDQQDGLYTLCVQGIEYSQNVQRFLIQSAINRVLSAQHEWKAVLHAAAQDALQVILSNTTEVGIQLDETDDPFANPPRSFPGKLLAVLYARFQAVQGNAQKGFVIVPTELIPDNGDRLRDIVHELARIRKLPQPFVEWINKACVFCNSLVDRIVPGKLPEDEQRQIELRLGYRDELMIQAEPYRLWAIETEDPRVENIINWGQVDEGLIIAADITRYREMKLRLLNGTHTFSCGLAYLMGFDTVVQAMHHPAMTGFLRHLMFNEIAPVIVSSHISLEDAHTFAEKVLERFANPYLKHHWIDITVEYTAKMRMRNVPLIQSYYRQFKKPPENMALGFAAYLLFMRGETKDLPGWNSKPDLYYPIRDSQAAYFTALWKKNDSESMVT